MENDLRRWMQLVQGTPVNAELPLLEAVMRIVLPNSILTVLKNPMKQQTMNFLLRYDDGVRGSVDTVGNLYIWDAMAATHEDIASHLDDATKHRLSLYDDSVTTDDEESVSEIARLPALLRAYGGRVQVNYEE